jgi:DNA-binding IclR family transcriptional regulator
VAAVDSSAVAAGQSRARRAVVAPFARALLVMEAWTPGDTWLGNLELAQRTGLPTSTVTRIAQSLVQLGYLRHAPEERKYRLAVAVMALGYGAIANSDVQRAARGPMRAYAEEHGVHVHLAGRERLDVIVLETCKSPGLPTPPALAVGSRVGIASSPMGWALLATLPELERYYLMENVQRRLPREWARLSRRSSEGIAQMHEVGWCAQLGERDQDVVVVAAPLLVPDHAPLVLSCLGPASRMARARIERELAPRLLGIATEILEACTAAPR